MKLLHLAGIAAAVIGVQGTASAATYEAVAGTGFISETTSVTNLYLEPLPPVGSTVSSFSVLSTATGFATTGTISFVAPVTSYTFLWGSPDSFNSVTDGTISVTGSSVSSGTGNNAESLLYTFADAGGFSALTFTTTGVAFEVASAAAPVPEPQSYALLLAGFAAVGEVARRRRPRSGSQR